MTKKDEEAIAIGLPIVIFIAVSIIISKKLFPYFLGGSLISFVLLVGVGICELFFREHSYLDIWNYFSTYIGLFFIVCFVGTGITYIIGYGLGGTSIGEASLQVYDSLNQAETQLDISISQVIDDSCKTLDEESCNVLKQNYKTFKTVKEVSDMTDSLRKGAIIVEKVTR